MDVNSTYKSYRDIFGNNHMISNSRVSVSTFKKYCCGYKYVNSLKVDFKNGNSNDFNEDNIIILCVYCYNIKHLEDFMENDKEFVFIRSNLSQKEINQRIIKYIVLNKSKLPKPNEIDDAVKLLKNLVGIKKYVALYKMKDKIQGFDELKVIPTSYHDFNKYLNFNIKHLRNQFNSIESYQKENKRHCKH